MGALSFDDLVPTQPAQGGAPSALAPIDFNDLAPPNPATVPVYSGGVLPITQYADGHNAFDSNAGLVGMAKRAYQGLAGAVNLTGETAKGHVDLSNPETMAAAIPSALDAAGAFSPLNPGMNAGDLAIPGVANALVRAKVTAPTAEALHAAGGAGFDAARNMGVEYASPAVADMARAVQERLNQDGVTAELAPKAHSVLNRLQAVPAEPSTVPFGNLDAARKTFGRMYADPVGEERYAAGQAKDAINGFVTSPDPRSVVAGPASAAAQTLADAIANSGAGFRSDRINDIERAADLRAVAANSGKNVGNSTRQRVASLLLNEKQSAGFSPDEIDALESVTRGTPTSNFARDVGNLLGGGGGMHGALSLVGGAAVGHEAAGPIGAAVGAATPLVGWAAKKLDNSLTTGRLQAADELTRSRSPLAQALASNAPFEVPNAFGRDALLRALMSSQGAQPAPAQQ